MDWGMFDGNLIETAHQVAGDWIVHVKGQRIHIQITVDAHGNYFYRNSHWFKNRQSKQQPDIRRGFGSLEQALTQAVKDIKAPFLAGNSAGQWMPVNRE